jgi:hypothetical protein
VWPYTRTTSGDDQPLADAKRHRRFPLSRHDTHNRSRRNHRPDRFTALPDHQMLDATVVALEEHGFSVDGVGDARQQPEKK